MGYMARFTGEIIISPPLTWAELNGNPEALPRGDLRIRNNEAVTDTATGQVITITGVAVVPADSRGPGYEMTTELQTLLDAYGGRHQFTGHIEAVGEDEGDRWRLLARDGKATQVHPHVTWPEEPGTTQEDDGVLGRFLAEWSARAGGRLVTAFRAAEKITAGQYVTPCGNGEEARPMIGRDRRGFGTAMCDAEPGGFVAVVSGGPR